MPYRVLADLVLVSHLAFIAFAVAGGLLALRWRWVPLLHVPAVLWGAYVELSSGVCPLTPLENALRRAAGDSGYSASFVEQYLLPVVYPASLTYPVQLGLAALLLLVNLGVYGLLLRRWRHGSRARPQSRIRCRGQRRA